MPYHEASFLNGLVSGLTATAGHRTGRISRLRMAGTERLQGYYAERNVEIYVSKVSLFTPYPMVILYEWGPHGTAEPNRLFRKIPGAPNEQTFFHFLRLPEEQIMANYTYNLYLYEWNEKIPETTLWSGFMAYPFTSKGVTRTYPGTPEDVHEFLVTTSRTGSHTNERGL